MDDRIPVTINGKVIGYAENFTDLMADVHIDPEYMYMFGKPDLSDINIFFERENNA